MATATGAFSFFVRANAPLDAARRVRARRALPRLGPVYAPRRPHETVLHELVLEHLETFLAFTQKAYRATLPRYVTDTVERYLACGDFAHAFVRCHCDIRRHDVLVPFSCKQMPLPELRRTSHVR